MKTFVSPKSRWRILMIITLAVLAGPYLFSRMAAPARCLSIHTADGATTPVATNRESLRVACYNIAHGRGLATSNWSGGNPKERSDRLSEIADLLRGVNADVVVLNEVDFDCSWSRSVNQARQLAEEAGYSYWVEQRNLDFRLLSFKWRFGNAILSKHPIVDAQVVDFPGFSSWETVLVGKKRGVRCVIRARDAELQVVGAHLSPRSEKLRVESARIITGIVTERGMPSIVAGDMNSTAPGYPEFATDSVGNNAIEVFDDSNRLQRSAVDKDAKEQLTFHSAYPRSVIDWVLIPADWRFLDYKVLASDLSDHRPVYADISPPTE